MVKSGMVVLTSREKTDAAWMLQPTAGAVLIRG
jgi:hypothetical protein